LVAFNANGFRFVDDKRAVHPQERRSGQQFFEARKDYDRQQRLVHVHYLGVVVLRFGIQQFVVNNSVNLSLRAEKEIFFG
jgi:hypothetical protein